jgi:allantoinase
MPLNAHPPTLDASSFGLKESAARASSVVDFGLWGGLTPVNLDNLSELADCGAIGFKAFMCPSGIDDFSHADTRTLREGMKRAAALRRIVAVHAESENRLGRPTGTTARDYLNSRPIAAELEAIELALELARETACALHVVHVSSAAGVRLVTDARARGQDVSCETCPHYLVLCEEDVERLGAPAKCAPPLRSAAERRRLFEALLAGEIDTIGSDHSPAPPEMKTSADFFKVWGGISGAQHLLPLLVTLGIPLPAISQVASGNVAARFGLSRSKGRVAFGCDADLAFVDVHAEFLVKREELFYRHPQSPYLGQSLRGITRRTLVRGQTVFQDGRVVGRPSGRLIRPELSC